MESQLWYLMYYNVWRANIRICLRVRNSLNHSNLEKWRRKQFFQIWSGSSTYWRLNRQLSPRSAYMHTLFPQNILQIGPSYISYQIIRHRGKKWLHSCYNVKGGVTFPECKRYLVAFYLDSVANSTKSISNQLVSSWWCQKTHVDVNTKARK